MHVELEPVGTKREAVIEGDDGVFRAKGRPAAVGVYERAGWSGQRFIVFQLSAISRQLSAVDSCELRAGS